MQTRTRKPVDKGRAVRRLPLVAYALGCGHVGREYGVQRGDLLWCADCGDRRGVARVLA